MAISFGFAYSASVRIELTSRRRCVVAFHYDSHYFPLVSITFDDFTLGEVHSMEFGHSKKAEDLSHYRLRLVSWSLRTSARTSIDFHKTPIAVLPAHRSHPIQLACFPLTHSIVHRRTFFSKLCVCRTLLSIAKSPDYMACAR